MSILAAVMPGPREAVEIREFVEPALEDGSVLLQTLYSEVCGTDVHSGTAGCQGVPYPIIPGHVSVGVGRQDSRPGPRASMAALFAKAIGWPFSTYIAPAGAVAPAP
jgi:D-arabinose 1-dehydrogenase-like Zn-dependent alcohol dehydrogenase